MPPASHLLAFALISFALIIVPGPNVIFVITRSLMLGRAAGVPWTDKGPRPLDGVAGPEPGGGRSSHRRALAYLGWAYFGLEPKDLKNAGPGLPSPLTVS